jgi:hypothetical protein
MERMVPAMGQPVEKRRQSLATPAPSLPIQLTGAPVSDQVNQHP